MTTWYIPAGQLKEGQRILIENQERLVRRIEQAAPHQMANHYQYLRLRFDDGGQALYVHKDSTVCLQGEM